MDGVKRFSVVFVAAIALVSGSLFAFDGGVAQVAAWSWHVLIDGKVTKAPELIEAAKYAKPGACYRLVGYPDQEGASPVYYTVTFSDGSDPAPTPVPPRPVPIPDPPGPVLSNDGAAAKAAMVNYSRKVGDNYRAVAAKNYATVKDAMAELVRLDDLARKDYEVALKAIMGPRLNMARFDLPPEAAKMFNEMADGFSQVK